MNTVQEQEKPVEAPPSTGSARKLRRSRRDRVVGGVCGGLGEHFDVDPVLLRIAFVALVLAGGSGVLLYVVAWIAIPEDPLDSPASPARPSRGGQSVLGVGLVALGAILLLQHLLPDFDRYLWPVVLIGLGAALLLRGERA